MLQRFFIVLCFFIVSLNANALLSFSQEVNNGRTYWVVNGRVDLPNNNMVSLKINFGDSMINRSNKVLYVRNSAFIYKYPLGKKSRVLPGKYTASFVYNLDGSVVEEPHDFYIGDFYQEQLERAGYKEYFKNTMTDVKNYLEQVRIKSEEFLVLKQVKQEPVIAWIKKIQQKFLELKTDCANRMYPLVLAPYSQANMTRIQQIITYSETIAVHYYVQVVLAAKMTKDEKGLLQQSSVDIYLQNIDKLMKDIEKTEGFPKYLNEDSLVADLQVFQNIFVNLSKQYQANLKKFDNNSWGKIHTEFESQVAMYQQRINEYSESPLSKKYPNLCPNMGKLLAMLEKLEDSYSKNLYDRAGIGHELQVNSTETELQNKIKDQFAKVYEVVENHLMTEQKQKVDLLNLMTKNLTQVRDVQDQLKEGYTKYIKLKQDDKWNQEEFDAWQSEWKKSIVQLQSDLTVLYNKKEQNIFENFPMNWLFFISYLQSIEKLYTSILDNKQDLEILVKVNAYHVKIENEIQNLSKRINELE